ncbi:uncharacterized protein LOC123301820 isoform X2 [Chrysoperla carnea]|nr:uncharacterized protein LOC123301820 isoform X2 [Chrysoperla carnea]
MDDSPQLRTHIFFAPTRSSYSFNQHEYEEPKCGPVLTSLTLIPSSGTMSSSENEPPQPLVVRGPADSLPWPEYSNSTKSTNIDFPTSISSGGGGSRQQSVSFRSDTGGALMKQSRSEPISLSTLDRDCFIIPVQRLDRFLPAGLPVPLTVPGGTAVPEKIASPTSTTSSGNISVLEVSDPKLCVLAHLMSPLEPIDPVLETPLTQPLTKQRQVAIELLNEVAQAKNALGGMLLSNMERNAEFPFISYYLVNSAQTDPSAFYNQLRVSSLSKFDPRVLRYTAAHTLDLYSEVAAICRPPLQDPGTGLTRSHTPYTGYIISVYKVFDGDDREKFERNWLYWTGARMLYRYLPKSAGLKRIALHKSLSTKGDKMYLLVCECATLLQDVSATALLIPALRARLCGYTGLYRPIQSF